jgi:hypothetical protein
MSLFCIRDYKRWQIHIEGILYRVFFLCYTCRNLTRDLFLCFESKILRL